MKQKWLDLYIDGRRLNKIIKFLQTKMKQCEADDSDSIIRFANSIAYLTTKKIEIIDRVLGVKHLLKIKDKTENPNEKYVNGE